MTKSEHKHLGRILGGRDALAGVISWWKSKAPKRRSVSPRKLAKKAKKLSKKGARADVRAYCVRRAGPWCEACACSSRYPLELDHFLGRAISETVETCWMLCRECHHAKTENFPSRAAWDTAFQVFCGQHGYPLVSRLTKSLPSASPTANPSPPTDSVGLVGGEPPDAPFIGLMSEKYDTTPQKKPRAAPLKENP